MRGPFDPKRIAVPGMLVLSGLDGTGKSTQAGLISARAGSEGLPVKTIWSRWKPTVTAPFIRLARKRLSSSHSVLESDYADFTEAKKSVMRSKWKQAVWQTMVWSEYALQIRGKTLLPLKRGTGIVCDRYVYDTLIDIAVNFSIPPESLGTLCSHPLLTLFPKPLTVVFFDIDPGVGAARKSDGTPEAYLADRRTYYLEMARLLGAPVIDAGRSIEEVYEQVSMHLESWKISLRRGWSQ